MQGYQNIFLESKCLGKTDPVLQSDSSLQKPVRQGNRLESFPFDPWFRRSAVEAAAPQLVGSLQLEDSHSPHSAKAAV